MTGIASTGFNPAWGPLGRGDNGVTQATTMLTMAPAPTMPMLAHHTVSSPTCWKCGRTMAEFLTTPYSLHCPRCKTPNKVLPSASTTAVQQRPRPLRHPREAAG